ncbi:transposase zinc-binding domain-containing protein [Nitrosomonas sp. Is79A3]|uniref:transposase zinc-binding domain-containing protein n=1 Tax=Nitrosomonas sp. (strain Is79A3) TaxID=261292 RepID=UPI00059E53E6
MGLVNAKCVVVYATFLVDPHNASRLARSTTPPYPPHGFLRLRCADGTHEKLAAVSCKRRLFCPSCGGRRVGQTATHLIDHGIPNVPVLLRVLSLSIPLRYIHTIYPHLLLPVL